MRFYEQYHLEKEHDTVLIFFIYVITAAVAVLILLLFLQVPHHAKAMKQQKISYIEDMKEGLHYIRNRRYVKTIL